MPNSPDYLHLPLHGFPFVSTGPIKLFYFNGTNFPFEIDHYTSLDTEKPIDEIFERV